VLEGTDGLDLLQRISTNDVSKVKIGEHIETVLTNEKGRIVDLLNIYRRSSNSLVLAGSSNQTKMLSEWIGRFIVMEDASLKSVNDSQVQYLVFDLRDESIIADIAKHNIVALRHEHSYAHQVLFLADKSSRHHLESTLEQHGIRSGTLEQYEIYRIEHGLPGYPNEISLQYNPLEIGLESRVSFSKGCYVGQEVIARLDTYQKTQKRLQRIILSDIPDRVPTNLLTPEREEAGILTSWCRSQNPVKRILGLGLVTPRHEGGQLVYSIQRDDFEGRADIASYQSSDPDSH